MEYGEKALETSELEEFVLEDEGSFIPSETQDSPMLEVVESESQPERQEDKGKKWAPDEEFRLVYIYLREIAKEPLLTPEEEVEISAKIKRYEARAAEIEAAIAISSQERLNNKNRNGGKNRNRDRKKYLLKRIEKLQLLVEAYLSKAQNLKQRFIKANLKLVISISNRFRDRGLPLLDLIQEGNIGLMRAVEKFDHTMGYRFSTYASWWIHQSISRALLEKTKTVRVPLYLLEQVAKVYTVKSMLYNQTGREPFPEEIAAKAGVSVEGTKQILRPANNTVSLDSSVRSGKTASDSDQKTFLDFIANEGSPTPDSVVAKVQLMNRIKQALSLLSPREREIIKMRFGIGHETTYTLDEIGKKFNLTRERIRQKEKRALKKLSTSESKKLLRNFLE